jgi:hypothetical protein
MGTKFANIQVRENDIGVVESALCEYIKNHDRKRMGNIFSMIMDSYEYSIGKINDGWITIVHPSMEFENVEEIALGISKFYKGTLLAVGYFDDAVFGMSVIKSEKILTVHISGESKEYFGMPCRLGNINTMIRELALNVVRDKLKSILEIVDLEELVKELENSLNVTLRIKYDWLVDFCDVEFKTIK